ncbi:MAG: NapC/NirT family cytochrome c [Verrucomicrobia bacterium]|nr:NapC/NirT family cytochrome c [Verrucomicrobiota bacterium]
MNDSPTPSGGLSRSSFLRNWTSLVGLVIVIASLFAFLLLFVLDSLAHFANPYVGVLTYLVTPAFLVLGLMLAVVGALVRRWRIARAVGSPPPLQIDLSRPRDRRIFAGFLVVTVLLLLFTALSSYHTYHFTESVPFCGQACHTVMQPELVTYRHSPHAKVSCTECHIGPGATWYVRSKLSGTYQVYATLKDIFPRPIPTPIKNLRPAQETCEQCHWPQKFVGNLDRAYSYFLTDETNSYHEVRLLLKVGGGDPTHGPVGGIHWHMNVGNKVEYFANDAARQKIPWVRLTDHQGVVTEFRSPGFTNGVDESAIRVMDCMDCHNRPAHMFESPNAAVDLAMKLGKIDSSMPYIKTNAVYVLTQCYTNETDAVQKIATHLANQYPGAARIGKTIETVQQIYRDNFFPEMKANWRVYPDNIGHKDWPGCFRCHDGKHTSKDGKSMIKANDCNACHLILAQGSGSELEKLHPGGLPFEHPGEEYDKEFLCSDCHTGGP